MNTDKLPLHRKYRPKSLSGILGNVPLVESLETILERDTGRPTTILLQGPSGCGKTTIARILAKELGAKETGIKELNISNTRGIDAARTIIDGAGYAPLGGKCKVIILNECHKATNDFQNAMLEILEEPPPNTYFILCTTEPAKLLKAVKTRCTTYQVELLLKKDLVSLLKKVCKKEKATKFPESAMKKIAEAAEGSPRQALVILDSVIGMKKKSEILEAINTFSSKQNEVIDLCRALYNGAPWKELAGLIKSIDAEPESIRYAVLGYFASVLLNKGDDRSADLIECFTESYMYVGKAGLVASCHLASKL